MSATKLYWYDAPSIPFLAIVGGIGIFQTIQGLILLTTDSGLKRNAIAVVFVFLLSVYGYVNVINSNQDIPNDEEGYQMINYLKVRSSLNMDGYKVFFDHKNLERPFKCELQKFFYKGQKVYRSAMNNITPGDIVVTDNAEDRRIIQKSYEHKLIDALGVVETWKLTEEK